MRSLLNFLLRNHFFLLFLILETISLLLVVQFNYYQKASFMNFTRHISNFYYDNVSGVKDYWSLQKTNKDLAEENARLRNALKENYFVTNVDVNTILDTIKNQEYKYISAKVINNSVNKQHNYLTINKGSIHGIEPEMGVVCTDGVVGVVKGVSEHFSTVISLLNTHFSISAKLLNQNYFGSLRWEGDSYTSAYLYEIPHHVQIELGDTIITSGYSSIFPEGILIGTVSKLSGEVQNFLEIEIKLSTNFRNLSYINVVNHLLQEEQLELEEELDNE